MKQKVWVLIIMVAIAISGCSKANEGYGLSTVSVNGIEFDAEVPLNEEGFQKGLMFRESLDDNHAMLFDFNSSAERTFWMKNTLIPLDMLFMDENLTIRRISNAIPCTADPCPTYSSGAPVQYVLEIRGGLAAELGIREGDGVSIHYG